MFLARAHIPAFYGAISPATDQQLVFVAKGQRQHLTQVPMGNTPYRVTALAIHIPEIDRAFKATRGQPTTIVAERSRQHRAGKGLNTAYIIAGLQVPQRDLAMVCPGSKAIARGDWAYR